MKNKPLLFFRIFAVLISVFGMSYRLIFNPLLPDIEHNRLFQLGFFSVQSGIYITVIFIFLLFNQLTGRENKWPMPAFRGAALLYGIITSSLFGAFFVGSFDVQGLNLVVLFINHILLTVLIMIDNIMSIPSQTYKFDLLIYWMIYPVYYLIFTIYESYVLKIHRYYFLVFDNTNASFYPYIIFLMSLMFILCAIMIIFINKIYRKREDT